MLLTAFATFIILISYNIKKKNWIKTIIELIDLESVIVDHKEYFSKAVIDVYLSVLKNPNEWELNKHTLSNEKGKEPIHIWASNEIDNRRFYDSLGKCVSTEENNNQLTYYDKLLLDKIINSYKSGTQKVILKMFVK